MIAPEGRKRLRLTAGANGAGETGECDLYVGEEFGRARDGVRLPGLEGTVQRERREGVAAKRREEPDRTLPVDRRARSRLDVHPFDERFGIRPLQAPFGP